MLAEIAAEVLAAGPIGSLVLIGGETSYAVLTRLGTTAVVPRGRFAPLVSVTEIADGAAQGATLITKGGSGGTPDSLAELLASARDAGAVTVSHAAV
jgi:uncharacterized protein YgbK (DUF1537 family)